MFFFLISSYVGAHSYVQQSYPSHGEVIENSIQDISLRFDAGIESSSVIEIFRSNGEEVPLQELIVDSPYIEATLVNPLATDDYKLNWLVIGDDGHPTEGTIEFSVILPQVEEGAKEKVTEQEEANETGEDVVEERETNEDLNDEIAEEQTITENNQDQSLNMLLIGILFIAIIVVLFVVSKRKR